MQFLQQHEICYPTILLDIFIENFKLNDDTKLKLSYHV